MIAMSASLPDGDDALSRVEAHDPGRVGAALGDELRWGEPAREHAVGVDDRQQRLQAGQSHRDLRPVPLPARLLRPAERAGVGRDDRDLALLQALPEPLLVLLLLDLGAAGEEVAVGPVEDGVVEHEVLAQVSA